MPKVVCILKSILNIWSLEVTSGRAVDLNLYEWVCCERTCSWLDLLCLLLGSSNLVITLREVIPQASIVGAITPIIILPVIAHFVINDGQN